MAILVGVVYVYSAVLFQLITCVTLLLAAQPSSVWSDGYVQTMLQTVINFTVHPKPKVIWG